MSKGSRLIPPSHEGLHLQPHRKLEQGFPPPKQHIGKEGGQAESWARNSLQHVSVERLLAIAQELSYHLAAEAFPLEEEVGHTDGGVRDEPT